MDIATVLEIIKMIDTRIKNVERKIELSSVLVDLPSMRKSMIKDQTQELIFFRDHLQSFIEGQLNAAENSTGE